jgi:hypothetical protein
MLPELLCGAQRAEDDHFGRLVVVGKIHQDGDPVPGGALVGAPALLAAHEGHGNPALGAVEMAETGNSLSSVSLRHAGGEVYAAPKPAFSIRCMRSSRCMVLSNSSADVLSVTAT